MEDKHLVKNLSFSVESGKSLAVVGESGCGKTMTALSLFGLLPKNCSCDGEICFENQNLLKVSALKMRKHRVFDMVFIPQSGAEFLDPSLTIKSQFVDTLKLHKFKHAEFDKIIVEKLLEVGFEDGEKILKMYPFQLSGGMAQRVVLAMSAIGKPKIVVADEATRGIDEATAKIFLDKIDKMFCDAGKIIITHNMDVASRCDDILVMLNGEVVEYGCAKSMLANPQAEYTKKLLKAKSFEVEND